MTSIEACTARAIDWLCLAAAPCFACMAVLTQAGGGFGIGLGSGPGGAGMICSSARGAFALDGMTAMYLLMAVFHLPPWLRLIQRATFQAS